MTDDQRLALETFTAAARAHAAAEARQAQTFAAVVAAQDAHAEATQALARAKGELDEAQQDLVAELLDGAGGDPTDA